MDDFFFLRNGAPAWPVDVRSVGLDTWRRTRIVERKKGAPFTIFMWTLEGKGFLRLRGKRRSLEPGWLFAIPCRTPHAYGFSGTPPSWRVAWFTLDGPLCARFLAALGFDRALVRPACLLPDVFFRRLSDSAQDSGIAGAMDRIQHALRMVLEIRARAGGLIKSARPERFKGLAAWARENIRSEVNVDYLARRAGLTRSHFSRAFKEETGLTPIRFLQEMRLARARALLLNSGRTVKEIAAQCGFFDTAHFSRQFAVLNGLSPSAYRSQART